MCVCVCVQEVERGGDTGMYISFVLLAALIATTVVCALCYSDPPTASPYDDLRPDEIRLRSDYEDLDQCSRRSRSRGKSSGL